MLLQEHFRQVKLSGKEHKARFSLCSTSMCSFRSEPKGEPCTSHVQSMLCIGRYIHATKNKGLIYQPKPQSYDLWCDVDFSGNWSPETAHIDTSTAKSRTGFIITFAGCPIALTSKLQTEVALSTSEAKFIPLSEGLRSAIPLISLVKEFRDKGVPMLLCQPKIHCCMFEDDNGALEMAKTPKF